jgi:hypothetical protein
MAPGCLHLAQERQDPGRTPAGAMMRGAEEVVRGAGAVVAPATAGTISPPARAVDARAAIMTAFRLILNTRLFLL